MAEVLTDNEISGTETISKRETSKPSLAAKVFESRPFATAMNIGEKYAFGKSKIYKLLHHAFEKLREESSRHRIQTDFKEKTSVLMRMAKAYYNGSYKKVPSDAVFRIVGGLVYFVWILDLIPDFIPILGFADDLAVIVWIYNGLDKEIQDFEQWESLNR